MTERIEIGSGGGIVTHEGDGSGLPICNQRVGRVPGRERVVSPDAQVDCSTCLQIGAPELFTSREDVARWELEAQNGQMTSWKNRYLVAMKWLHEAEKAAGEKA